MPELHAKQLDDPVFPSKVPALQLVQATVPVVEANIPTKQLKQFEERVSADVVRYVPKTQPVQLVDPVSVW